MNVNVKVMTAALGAGALLAMGGITVATSAAEPAEPGPVVPSEITTGETSTDSAAATTSTTVIATPEITGSAELPTEQQGLPG